MPDCNKMPSLDADQVDTLTLREHLSGKGLKVALAAAVIALACFITWGYSFSSWRVLFSPDAPLSLRAEDCQKGAYVKFGRYPQNDSGRPEPIEWQVLENDGKTALLVAKCCLDCKPFNNEYRPVSWRDCDLRKWLNGHFLRKAFTRAERARILESTINTGDNEAYNTPGCGETRDKLFCLSIDEANEFFASDEERKREPTNYANSGGLLQFANGFCCYWLRNPGYGACVAAAVTYGGAIIKGGADVNRPICAVLPALRIDLEG
ncbi:MAG: DUF6273 domain-containing protein [bacterium]|nr:DUF6273 domain-containing protein [bacterium]